MADKSDTAFRTIGELATELGIAQHVLRYWETKFPQLRPLQRAGNRRYYRPDDVALARRIDRLLNHEGYTVRGVQMVLEGGGTAAPPVASPGPGPETAMTLREIRDALAALLDTDAARAPNGG